MRGRRQPDYVDLTGEPEFVDLMYLRYHASRREQRRAARAFVRLRLDPLRPRRAVHRLASSREREPVALSGYVRAGGTFSGGTLHSAVEIMGRLRQAGRVARERRAVEGTPDRPEGRRVRGVAGRPHVEPLAGGWVVPAPTIDPQHVLRSARATRRLRPRLLAIPTTSSPSGSGPRSDSPLGWAR